MTEIQLRRIVDRTAKEQQSQQSEGDETMTKNGKTVSKFSKEAMNISEDALEHEVVLRKVYLVCDKWVGNDSVFPLTNGAPIKDHDQIQGQTVQLRTSSWVPTQREEVPLCEGHELGKQDSHLFSYKRIC